MLSLILTVLMHPVHASLSEVTWNPANHRLEVSMRLAPEDAKWIAAGPQTEPSAKPTINRNVDFAEENPSVETQRIARYVAERYNVAAIEKDGDPMPAKICWVGNEFRGGHVWWHFEIIPTDGNPPDQMKVLMLLDREPNYQHRMVILGLDRPTALDFTAQRTQQATPFWTP